MEYKDYIGLHKNQLDTPCLVLDIKLVRGNLECMKKFAEKHQKQLRPHAKTHKCSKLAKLQLDFGAIGICTAKVSEALVLAEQGISDLLITSPVVSHQKIETLFKIREITADVNVVVDNLLNAELLNQTAKERQVTLNVLLDIDPEMGRTGVHYESAVETAKSLSNMSHLSFCGIQCYSGLTQHILKFRERQDDSLRKMKKAADIFNQLNAEGTNCRIFTGTGTGTHDIDIEVPELTDMQVGSYVVMDAEYYNIGSRHNDNCFDAFKPALTVLSTVISTNQPDWVTIDAGLKAIYLNDSAPLVIKPENNGWKYNWFGDEHGKLLIPAGEAKPELGSIVELSSSHCDPTINLYDHYFICEDDIVIDVWPIDCRGKCQ